MCRNLAEGGRRCRAHTDTGRAVRTVERRRDRNLATGDVARAERAQAGLERLTAARDLYGDVVTPMKMDLPESVDRVFSVVVDAGFRPLIVGGSVRDALTGDVPKDIDVEVYGATVDEVAAVLSRHYQVNEVGKAFGVLKAVLPDGTDLDVSVPRRDNHVGAGHRGFEVEMERSMTASEAAARRDFTINAMGYDPEFRVCVDPYGGRADLKAGRLRHTSAAFAEDPLRVLRGFQFAARFDLTVDPDTATLCRDLAGRAGELPVERSQGEWGKFFGKAARPSAGLVAMSSCGWDRTVPGLTGAMQDVTLGRDLDRAAALCRAEGIAGPDRQRLVAAIIASRMPPERAGDFVQATVEGAQAQREALGLALASPPEVNCEQAVRAWAFDLSASGTNVAQWHLMQRATGAADLERADRLQSVAFDQNCLNSPQPDLLLGRDIVRVFSQRRPGPWTGEVQRAARQAQVAGAFIDREGALGWLSDLDASIQSDNQGG